MATKQSAVRTATLLYLDVLSEYTQSPAQDISIQGQRHVASRFWFSDVLKDKLIQISNQP